jgi:hypothetical protein
VDMDEMTFKSWRAVYSIDPDTAMRTVIGEYHYADVDLALCTTPEMVYPHPEGRLHYMHAFQMTENYITMPGSSHMFNPCSVLAQDGPAPVFSNYRFEPSVESALIIMNKTSGEFTANITVPSMFVTHMLGAYEDGDLMHLDMLVYNDAAIYTHISYVENIFEGGITSMYMKWRTWVTFHGQMSTSVILAVCALRTCPRMSRLRLMVLCGVIPEHLQWTWMR